MTFGQLVLNLRKDGLHRGSVFDGQQERILETVWQTIPLEPDLTKAQVKSKVEEAFSAANESVDCTIGSCFEQLFKRLRNDGLIARVDGTKKYVKTKKPYLYPLDSSAEKKNSETDSYEDIRWTIKTKWARESPRSYLGGNRFCRVLDTQGLQRGRWNAPDITLFGGKMLPFLPGKFLDIVTFEIKPELDITGLYEALSHRAHATHSYLLCYPGKQCWGDLKNSGEVERLKRDAARTGVGVILARRPDDFGTWEEIAPAIRWRSDPELRHDFLRHLYKNTRAGHTNAIRELRDWIRQDPFLGDRPSVDFKALFPDNEEDQRRAEDIYLELPLGEKNGVGPSHFKDWIDADQVKRIRDVLASEEVGVIKSTQGGGMYIPAP